MSETMKSKVMINGEARELELFQRQNGFDPMTGQPVMEIVCRTGFDPMTGQPVYVPVKQNGFDPMTGQPVYVAASAPAPAPTPAPQPAAPAPAPQPEAPQAAAPAPAPQAAPAMNMNMQQPAPQKPAGKKNFLPLIIIGGAVILTAAIVIIGLLSGAFLSKRDKVALATLKTLQDSTIGSTLIDSSNVLSSDQLTASVDGSANAMGANADFDVNLAMNLKKSLLDYNVYVDLANLIELNGELYFDDSMVALALPDATDEVYFYDYTKENEGYLTDAVESLSSGDISDVDTLLSSVSVFLKKMPSCEKSIEKAFKKAYKNVDVVSIGKETFEVDGKDRKCAGYEMTITGENMADMVYAYTDALQKVYGDTISDSFEAIDSLTGQKMSKFEFDDPDTYDDILREFDTMEDVVIDFYIYGGKLAALVTEDKDQTIVIEFLGGDTRCSNILVSVDDNEACSIESSLDGGVEEGSIYVSDNEVLSYEYDKKSGEYSVSVMGMNDFDGIFKVDKHSIDASADVDIQGVSASFNAYITDSARISEPKGGYVDLGDADEEDLEDIFSEIQDSFKLNY